MRVVKAPFAQPTLWRTCRVLANRTRLKILSLLAKQSSHTVSAVADQVKLAVPAASQYLRALEARGLLTCRRKGRYVHYRFGTTNSGPVQALIPALRSELHRKPSAIERVFKLATAFTHPRRIEIFRVLRAEPRTLVEIRSATNISIPALFRHLSKLEARGFAACESGRYLTKMHPNPLGRALARLASE